MKFKVGDLVIVNGDGVESRAIVVSVDEIDLTYPYRAFVYDKNKADWFKESELTLKSP